MTTENIKNNSVSLWKVPLLCINCKYHFEDQVVENPNANPLAYILPCKHNVCANCLNRSNAGNLSSNEGILCRKCDKLFEFDNTLPLRASFEVNNHMFGNISYAQEILLQDLAVLNEPYENKPKPELDSTCFECENSTNLHCVQCSEPYCTKCFDIVHKTAKILKGHCLAEIEQHKSYNWRYTCVKHPNELNSKFCNDCQETLCDTCVQSMHQTHNIDTINDKNEMLRDNVVDLISSIDEQILDNLNAQQVIEEQKLELVSLAKEVISEQLNHYMELHNTLQNSQRHTLFSIREKMLNNNSKLYLLSDEHKKRFDTLCKFKDGLQKMLEKTSNSVCILDVIDDVKKTLETVPSISDHPVKAQSFEINTNPKILEEIGTTLQINEDNSKIRVDNLQPQSIVRDKTKLDAMNGAIQNKPSSSDQEKFPMLNSNKAVYTIDNATILKLIYSVSFNVWFCLESNSTLRKLSSSHEIANNVKVGHMYLIPSRKRDALNRVIVLKEIGYNHYWVKLVDLNHETIFSGRFLECPPELQSKPSGCTKGKLFALKPKKYNLYPDSSFRLVQSLIYNCDNIKLIMIDDKNIYKTVDFILTKDASAISLRDCLIYVGLAENIPLARVNVDIVQRMNDYDKIKNILVSSARTLIKTAILAKDIFDAKLLHVVGPMEFYVGKDEHFSFNMKLQKALNNFYQNEELRNRIFVGQLNMPCAVFVNSTWNRAVIEEIHDCGKIDVRLVDTGEAIQLSWKELYVLDNKFLSQDCYAIECCLFDLEPSKMNGFDWTQILIDKCKNFAANSSVQISVQKVEDFRCEVVLSAIHCGNRVILNTQVIEMIENHSGQFSPSDSSKNKNKKSPKGERVKILHITNPNDFYVQFFNDVPLFAKIHREIQNDMNQSQKSNVEKEENNKLIEELSWRIGDKCLVKTLLPKSTQPFWYRGIIKNISNGQIQHINKIYDIFLEDYGRIVHNIKSSNMHLYEKFKNHVAGAVSCSLAFIKPTGGLDNWSETCIDRYKAIVNKNSALFMTDLKFENENQKMVILRGMNIENVNPLAPDVFKYVNINQLLVNEGLAHLTGKMDSESESNQERNAIVESLKWTKNEINKVQEIVDNRTVNADVYIENSLRIGLKDLTLAEDSSEKFNTWLPPVPIAKTIFTAYVTNIDTDGCIYLHEYSAEYVLKEMCHNINKSLKESKPSPNVNWYSGQACLCRYKVDNNLYRAVVLQIFSNGIAEVRFVDYGNIEKCLITDLRNTIWYPKVPIQANQYIIENMSPLGGAKAYSQEVLDAIHVKIVGPLCNIRVCADDLNKRLKRCSIVFEQTDLLELFYVKGLVDYNGDVPKQFIEGRLRYKQQFGGEINKVSTLEETTTYEQININRKDSPIDLFEEIQMKLPAVEEKTSDFRLKSESESSSYSQDKHEFSEVNIFDTNELSTLGLNVFHEYTIPSDIQCFKCKVVFINSPIIIYVFPLIPQHIRSYSNLQKRIQTIAKTAPPLTEFVPKTPCLAFFSEDQIWLRAIICQLSKKSQRVTVRFVDMFITKNVDINQLKQCHTEVFETPLRILRVSLHGINKKHILVLSKSFLEELKSLLQHKNVHARITSTNPELEVKLFRHRTDVMDIMAPLIQNSLC